MQACFSRISILRFTFSSPLCNLNGWVSMIPPPGAVAGLNGSGCFHLSSKASVCSKSSCVPSKDVRKLQSAHAYLAIWLQSAFAAPTNPLLSWLRYLLVRVEKRSNVNGLRAPYVSVNSPIEGKLQASSI